MKTRIYLPGRTHGQRRSLRFEVRSLLGSHRHRLESVEIRAIDTGPELLPTGRLCEVTVRFRQGGHLSIIEQEAHIGRALLRAAWRIEQSNWLGHGRSPSLQGSCAPS